MRTDALIFHQHVVDDHEAARTDAKYFDAANDGNLRVAPGIRASSVPHELKFFPKCG